MGLAIRRTECGSPGLVETLALRRSTVSFSPKAENFLYQVRPFARAQGDSLILGREPEVIVSF